MYRVFSTLREQLQSNTSGKGKNMNQNEKNTILFEHYWKYFNLQSSQRNQICLVYFPIQTLLITSYFRSNDSKSYQLAVLTLIVLTGLAGGLLFLRTTKLRDHARNCLTRWEEQNRICNEECVFRGKAENDAPLHSYSYILGGQFLAVVVLASAKLLMLLLDA